jgi:predicted transglutaminase-like cysteine proteinase
MIDALRSIQVNVAEVKHEQELNEAAGIIETLEAKNAELEMKLADSEARNGNRREIIGVLHEKIKTLEERERVLSLASQALLDLRADQLHSIKTMQGKLDQAVKEAAENSIFGAREILAQKDAEIERKERVIVAVTAGNVRQRELIEKLTYERDLDRTTGEIAAKDLKSYERINRQIEENIKIANDQIRLKDSQIRELIQRIAVLKKPCGA